MAIIRLAPPDYHRYHFPASGKASASVKIKGHYFSVSPLALKQSLKIFCENKREYCILQTPDYGDILIAGRWRHHGRQHYSNVYSKF